MTNIFQMGRNHQPEEHSTSSEKETKKTHQNNKPSWLLEGSDGRSPWYLKSMEKNLQVSKHFFIGKDFEKM